jgi:hypothetical protein
VQIKLNEWIVIIYIYTAQIATDTDVNVSKDQSVKMITLFNY